MRTPLQRHNEQNVKFIMHLTTFWGIGRNDNTL